MTAPEALHHESQTLMVVQACWHAPPDHPLCRPHVRSSTRARRSIFGMLEPQYPVLCSSILGPGSWLWGSTQAAKCTLQRPTCSMRPVKLSAGLQASRSLGHGRRGTHRVSGIGGSVQAHKVLGAAARGETTLRKGCGAQVHIRVLGAVVAQGRAVHPGHGVALVARLRGQRVSWGHGQGGWMSWFELVTVVGGCAGVEPKTTQGTALQVQRAYMGRA